MLSPSANPPVILTFAALDPSGSTGIQADIETCASIGAHCAPLVTSLCTSGETAERESIPVNTEILIEQARSILNEMDVRAIKLGFLGSIESMEAVHSLLQDCGNLPVVAHPSLCLWQDPWRDSFGDAFAELILPLVDVGLFTLYEAQILAREGDSLEARAREILSTQCENLLITGTGEQQPEFRNSLFQQRGEVRHFRWQQESAASQGASSTLAMSIAAYLAHGFSILQAVEEAQNFTWQATRASRHIGFGRSTLHRFFWADPNIDSAAKPSNKSSH